MRRILGLLLLMLLLGVPSQGGDQPREEKKQVEIGMSDTDVLRVRDRPRKIARQILFRRHLEQWTYDAPAMRIEFDCVLGQKAHVTSVQSLLAGKD